MKGLKDYIIRQSTEQEHSEAIDVMERHLNDQDAGKVGIFWYDVKTKSLFGVIAVDKDQFSKPNAGGGLITCKELHYKVWQKGYNRQKFKLNGKGPFKGDYKYTPRGRVFYNINTDTYEIKVGDWIDDCKDAIDEILYEFDLEDKKYEIVKDFHWDIGSGWENF